MTLFDMIRVIDDVEREDSARLLRDCPAWARQIAHLLDGMPPYNRLEQIATGAMHGYKRALIDQGLDEKTATERAGLIWYGSKP